MPIQKIKEKIWDRCIELKLGPTLQAGRDLSVKGLPGSLSSFFVSVLAKRIERFFLCVMPGNEEAEAMADQLSSLVGEENVAYFPGGEEDPESPLIINPRRAGLQMGALGDLLEQRRQMLVTSSLGWGMRVPRAEILKKASIVLEEGVQYDLSHLTEQLVLYGYTREVMVEKPGEISLRGGLLDVFPYTGEDPFRIEFFGDRVESMRTFDLTTQLSSGKGERIELLPTPIAWETRDAPLLSYVPKDAIVFIQDPDLVYGELEKARTERSHLNTRKTMQEEQKKRALQSITLVTLSNPEGVIDFGGRPIHTFGRTVNEIREGLASVRDTVRQCILFCEKQEDVRRTEDFLDLHEDPIPGLRVETGPINSGFHLPPADMALYTERELIGRTPRRRRRSRYRMGVPIRELSSLVKGDYVVHVDHGIGRFDGLTQLFVHGVERECISLTYEEDDKLYVPVDKMERVLKYSNREGKEPRLSKLGSRSWETLKARTKRTIKDIARDLIVLYSARQKQSGYAFSRDTTWQEELEAAFHFEDTPDQADAVAEVKKDMEKDRPMDRLICGDVGYGKTEVAVRAAFKAVNDGKQVAMLVPTTILAQQHTRTFKERLSMFPVHVETLSRFRTRKEQNEVVEGLKTGSVDIVIGTHRLLSKDVVFKDLGLVIIDEEQRFGVRHKERLKRFRETVDVITLSATPIPRTLQFSMMSIRDMSLINTPPKDRLPIITEVAPFDKELIGEAIHREITRKGQVFFVHNRIRSIYSVARMIRRTLPGIRLAVAHGQMEERELERVMLDFGAQKYDCLVSTMIIESGLDLPNVNTLIVHRADRLGLAQLYQLRGRVGRSDKRAYAYLLTPPFQHLSEDAIKRLRTIEEFTELGSGFQIALRDLEIRGAGNLLGVQQSGFMDAVGFDLYMKLVEEAVEELRSEDEDGESQTRKSECFVDFGQSAYLPQSYVEDESQRIQLYRQLAELDDLDAVEPFAEGVKDRFGPLPQEGERLMEGARLRILGQESGLSRIILKGNDLLLFFDEIWVERFPTPEAVSHHLQEIIQRSPVSLRFLHGKSFGLKASLPRSDTLNFTKKLLQSWR